MIMNLLKKSVNEMLTWKWIPFILAVFSYSWMNRQNIVDFSLSSQTDFNQWDIIMYILSAGIFLNCVFFAFIILFSCLTIRNTWNTSTLVRCGSWRRWVAYTTKAFTPVVIASVSYLVLISILLTVGCHYEWGWSPLGLIENRSNPLIPWILRQSGFPPYAALIIHIIIFVFFLFTLHSLMVALYALMPKLLLLSMFGFLLFFYAIYSFKYVYIDWLVPYNYMTFFSSLMTFHSIYPGLLILLALLLFNMYVLPSCKNWNLQSGQQWMKEKYPYVIYAALCLLGIVSPFLTSATAAVTVWDNLYLRFYGVSAEGRLSFLVFLFYIVAYLGYIYLFQVYVSDYLSGRFYYMAIRYGSLRNWFIRFAGQAGLGALFPLLGFIAVTVLGGWASGQSLKPSLSVLAGVTVQQVLYQFIVNGWLQMLNYLLIVFITTWLFKESINIIVMGALIFAILPLVNRGGWLPAGLNSMGYISGQWEDVYRITTVLMTGLVLECAIIGYLFKRKYRITF